MFIREPSPGFYVLPVKRHSCGQNIISSETKCWLHLLVFVMDSHTGRGFNLVSFGSGMQGGQSWNAWLVPPASLSNAESFRLGPGGGRGFAGGWHPLEGAVDIPWQGLQGGDRICDEEVWRAQRHQEHNSRAHRVRDLPFPLGMQPAQILRFKFCAKPLGLLGDLSLADLCLSPGQAEAAFKVTLGHNHVSVPLGAEFFHGGAARVPWDRNGLGHSLPQRCRAAPAWGQIPVG